MLKNLGENLQKAASQARAVGKKIPTVLNQPY